MATRPSLAVVLLATATCACATPMRRGAATSPARHGPLTVTLSAFVASEPAQIMVRTRVEPDVQNRELTVQWWNADGVGGSHSVSLEGGSAPIRHECAIRSMAAGEYTVTAVLRRNDGKLVHRATRMLVIPEGGRMDPEEISARLAR